MGIQTFEFFDYLAPITVFVLFWTTIFLLCVIINWAFITKRDDLTAFEKLGRRWNMRLGPHTMAQIRRRRAWTSTVEYEREISMNPFSKHKRQSLVSLEFKLVSATKLVRSVAFVP